MVRSINDLIYGFKFETNNQPLTYSLNSANAKWSGQDNVRSLDLFNKKSDLNTDWQDGFRAAIKLWSEYSDLSFEDKTNDAVDANIYAYRADVVGQAGATAWFANLATGEEYDAVPLVYARSEFVFDNNAIPRYSAVPNFQKYILLHEIGHAFGLRGDLEISGYNSVLDAGEYNTDMSVMSYFIPESGYYFESPTGAIKYDSIADARFAVTPMAYDIAALESLYGTSSINVDADTYSFTGAKVSRTIKDDGGVDTFDLSGYNGESGVSIDLNPTLGINDEWLDRKTIVGEEYIYLARGTVIENAAGTTKGDFIVGNAAQNVLKGGGGNDNLVGGGEKDFLFGELGNDTLDGGVGSDVYRFAVSGDGVDTIIDSDGDGVIWTGETILGGTAAKHSSNHYTLDGVDLTWSHPEAQISGANDSAWGNQKDAEAPLDAINGSVWVGCYNRHPANGNVLAIISKVA